MYTCPPKVKQNGNVHHYPQHSTLLLAEAERPLCQTRIEPRTMGQNSRMLAEATHTSSSDIGRAESIDLLKHASQRETSMRQATNQQPGSHKRAGVPQQSPSQPKRVNQRSCQSSRSSSEMRPQPSQADTSDSATSCVNQKNANHQLMFFLFESLASDLAAEIKNILSQLSTMIATPIEEPYYRDTQKYFLCLKCNWKVFPDGRPNQDNLLLHNSQHSDYTRAFSIIKQGSERLQCASCMMLYNRDVSFRVVESLIHHQRVFHTGLHCMSSVKDAHDSPIYHGLNQTRQSQQCQAPGDISSATQSPLRIAQSEHQHTESFQTNNDRMQPNGAQNMMAQTQHIKNVRRPQVSSENNNIQNTNSHYIETARIPQTSIPCSESLQRHSHKENSIPATLVHGLASNAPGHQSDLHIGQSHQVNTHHKHNQLTHLQNNWSEQITAPTRHSVTHTDMNVSHTTIPDANLQQSEINQPQSVHKSMQQREKNSELIHNLATTEETDSAPMDAEASIPYANILDDQQQCSEMRQVDQTHQRSASSSDKFPIFQNDDIDDRIAKRSLLQKPCQISSAICDLTDKSSVPEMINALISDSLNSTVPPKPNFPQIINCPVNQQKEADLVDAKIPDYILLTHAADVKTTDETTSIIDTGSDRLAIPAEAIAKPKPNVHLHQIGKYESQDVDLPKNRLENRTVHMQCPPTKITYDINSHQFLDSMQQQTASHGATPITKAPETVNDSVPLMPTSEPRTMTCTSRLNTKEPLHDSRVTCMPQVKEELSRKERRTVEFINLTDDESVLLDQDSVGSVSEPTAETNASMNASLVMAHEFVIPASFRENVPVTASPASPTNTVEILSPNLTSQFPGHSDIDENMCAKFTNLARNADKNGNVLSKHMTKAVPSEDIKTKIHGTVDSGFSLVIPGNGEEMSSTTEQLSPASTIGYENTDVSNNNEKVGSNSLMSVTTSHTTGRDMTDKKQTQINSHSVLIARLSTITNQMFTGQQPLIMVSDDEDDCFIVD